jgi:hypothetical protein
MRVRKIDIESYKERNICPRCHGAGEFPEWRDNKGGVCFRCWGHGKYYSPDGKYYSDYEYSNISSSDIEIIEEDPIDFKRSFKKRIAENRKDIGKMIKEARRKLRETEEEIIC